MLQGITTSSTPAPDDAYGQKAFSKETGQKVAIVDELNSNPSLQTLTWNSFVEARNKIANGLFAMGVRIGTKIVTYGYNSSSWLIARAATISMNCFFCPMNWHLASPEIAYILDNSDTEVCFVDQGLMKTLIAAWNDKEYGTGVRTKLRYVIVMNSTSAEALSNKITDFGSIGPITTTLERLLTFSSPLYPILNEPLVRRGFSFTGGTSGKPKAVVRSGKRIKKSKEHAKQAANGLKNLKLLGMIHPNQIQIVAAPLYHSAPNAFSSITHGMGGACVLMRRFDANKWLHLVNKYKVTCAFMPPILLKRVTRLSETNIRDYDSSSLISIVLGGAPCPMDTKAATLRLFGPVLYEFYGSSELGINTILGPHDMLRKRDSCGKSAAGVTIHIIDEKSGQKLPRGKKGVLYIADNNSLFEEYYKAKEKTESARLKNIGYTVGDIAYIDDEDFVFICDRKIDMIISGGANIYPAQIEDALHGYPLVSDCAVFGTPDKDYGENVHAAIQLVKGTKPTDELLKDLRKYLSGRIARFKIPRNFSFHDSLPRTPSGKLIKRKLRDKFWPKGGALPHTAKAKL